MTRGELMVIFGSPAVGKMTVGRAVCDLSDFRLFLNHHTIEPLADVFGMGTAPFRLSADGAAGQILAWHATTR